MRIPAANAWASRARAARPRPTWRRALVFRLVFLRTRSVVAAVALRALNNRWVVLNWQVRATYDAAPILGCLCSPGPP
mgnify:CR=1 FL=1